MPDPLTPQPASADPLAARPVVPEGIEVVPVPDGGLLLRRTDAPRNALARCLEKRLGMKRSRDFQLDATGAFFWSQIDGAKSLAAIGRSLRAEFGLGESAARDATMLFAKQLTERGLIWLRVDAAGPPAAGHRPPPPTAP